MASRAGAGRLARGIDDRAVRSDRETKSVSAETTFEEDIASYKPLEQRLWSLTERVSARLKAKGIAGSTVTLKLKTADFKLRTRARSLGAPTLLAARIFAAGRDLLAREIDGTRYRLIGSFSQLDDAERLTARTWSTGASSPAAAELRYRGARILPALQGAVFDGKPSGERTTNGQPQGLWLSPSEDSTPSPPKSP